MNIKNIEAFEVKGFLTRTKNSDEQNRETAKIAPLWERTRNHAFPHLTEESTVYGIYFNYESDATGEFDLLTGSDHFSKSFETELNQVNVNSGKYLVFSAKGEMPKAIIDAWGEVWEYFSNENSEHKRAYDTDFEKYQGFDSVEIYISIK